MNVVCQKDYLMQVRNAMLLHFGHKEICSALKDINEIFASGKEDGKTEEEMCTELGHPEEFVRDLRRDSRSDRFLRRISVYIVAILSISVFLIQILAVWNPLWWCIPVVIIPVCTWYLCGGRCLSELQSSRQDHVNTLRYKTVHRICNIAALALVIIQQGWIFALNISERILSSDLLRGSFLAVYYVSMLMVLLFTLFAVLMVYKIFHGDSLAVAVLMRAVGTICSSFSYLIYIRSFNGPGAVPVICVLPYVLSIAFSVFLVLRRKSVRGKTLFG